MNQEYKRHISILERSIDEHKRLVRKREKETEQIKNDLENNVLDTSALTNKVFIQELLISKKNILFLCYLVYTTRCRNQCTSYRKYFIK